MPIYDGKWEETSGNREWLMRSAIAALKPQTYVECGLYEGESLRFWNKHFPRCVGCEPNQAYYATCIELCRNTPSINVAHSASTPFLETVSLDVPFIAYFDQNWGESWPVYQDLEILTRRWPRQWAVFVHCLCETDHPLYNRRTRPTPSAFIQRIATILQMPNQSLVPNYKHPDLRDGYVFVNTCEQQVPFDARWSDFGPHG